MYLPVDFLSSLACSTTPSALSPVFPFLTPFRSFVSRNFRCAELEFGESFFFFSGFRRDVFMAEFRVESLVPVDGVVSELSARGVKFSGFFSLRLSRNGLPFFPRVDGACFSTSFRRTALPECYPFSRCCNRAVTSLLPFFQLSAQRRTVQRFCTDSGFGVALPSNFDLISPPLSDTQSESLLSFFIFLLAASLRVGSAMSDWNLRGRVRPPIAALDKLVISTAACEIFSLSQSSAGSL